MLLHFSASTVARMGRAVHMADQKPGGLSESEQKTAARLDWFLGGPWWRGYFAQVSDAQDDERATDIALRVADRYARNLTEGSDYQAVRMPVRPRPGLAPKYVLTLFTRHGEGAWHFADTLGKAGVEWEDMVRNSYAEAIPAPTLFGDGPSSMPSSTRENAATTREPTRRGRFWKRFRP